MSEWVLVPRTPTEAMMAAGRDANDKYATEIAPCSSFRALSAWEAMVAAAPSALAIPTLDAVVRFVRSNPQTSAEVVIDALKLSVDSSACSNGKLREIWKQAGGMVDKKDHAWIEADLLPGLLRLLAALPRAT